MALAGFLLTTSTKWLSALNSCDHDVYHLPAYAELEGEWIKAEPIAFHFEDGNHSMLLPLLERVTPAGSGSDAVTPYGYSPPVFSRNAPDSFKAAALGEFNAAAVSRGLVSTFIRLHPLICPSLSAPPALQNSFWQETARGQTVTMPLENDAADWLRQIASGHRYDLRKLRKRGFRLSLDTDSAWEAFPEIYRETMQRINARSAYFYSDEYIAAFRRDLEGNVRCAAIEDDKGRVLCAALFTVIGNMLQYHLSGTSAIAADLAPTKLLLAEMREWARGQGIKHFHLGGGFGSGNDTLFEFKSRFGGSILPFRTVSIVHDPEKFKAECERWQSESMTSLPGPLGFFPPYRAPIPVKSPEKVE
jgi:hypothetical protein